MICVFVKSMAYVPYPSTIRTSPVVYFTPDEYDIFKASDLRHKAKMILDRLDLERDRIDALRVWANIGRLSSEDIFWLNIEDEHLKQQQAAEEDKAMEELLGAGIVDLEDGETFTEEPLPEMPAEASETPFKSIPAVGLVESKPKGAKRAPRGSKKASKKEVPNGD